MAHVRGACLAAVRVVAFALVIFMIPPAHAAAGIATSARQAIMIDFDTGAVLLSVEPDSRMPTSSMSKIMTLCLVFDALKAGRVTLESELPVSEKAWRKGGSKMFVEVGRTVKVEDLIRGVAVQSGNDATIVLAEALSGSEEAFAIEMTRKAQALGMVNSHFTNASGWPDENHYSSARDLAILASYVIRTHPEYFKYFSETEFVFNNIRQSNRNPLLYRNIGADGMKTGHTDAAGYGLVGTAKRDGRRVVMVLNGLESPRVRAEESSRILDWGLRNFENVALFKKDEVVTSAPVVLGRAARLDLVSSSAVSVTIPVFQRKDLRVDVVYDSPVRAPVRKHDRVGTLRVYLPQGRESERMEVPLLAGTDVQEQGFFARAFSRARLTLTGR